MGSSEDATDMVKVVGAGIASFAVYALSKLMGAE